MSVIFNFIGLEGFDFVSDCSLCAGFPCKSLLWDCSGSPNFFKIKKFKVSFYIRKNEKKGVSVSSEFVWLFRGSLCLVHIPYSVLNC